MVSVIISSTVTALWTPIVTTLWTPMVDQIKYLPKIGENMKKLKKDSKELEGIRDEVEDKIKTATERANDMEKTKQVVKWLEKVQTMEDDVNKIEQDHTKLQKMCLGDFPLNCWSGYKISKRAANTAEEVEGLKREGDNMDVVVEKVVRNVQLKPDRSDLLPAIEVYLKDAIKHLQDDMTSMVGIWGMGGVGKTTLLTKINNHPDVGGFLVIWVVVSKELNRHKLQRDIAERIDLRLEPEGDSTVESQVKSQAASLTHFLQRQQQNKKILLLLDDLWESFNLEELGIPCHGVDKDNVPNCKVVFTTRNETTCGELMAKQKFPAHFELKKIKLECLEEEEAWELFKRNIGKAALDFISSDGRVEKHAKRVAEKCRGLPLTIVLIAQSMSSKLDLEEWKDAFNSIDKLGIQELLGEESVFRLLKVSYDRLGNESLRKCFLTCALWPEDYRIRKDELIRSWLGLDLIAGPEFDDINAAFTRGHCIIKSLEQAGLLLDAGEGEELYPLPYLAQYVKLHDIMREMALRIAKDYSKNSNKATEGAEEEQKWSEVEMAFTLRLPHIPDGLDAPTRRPRPNQTALMLRGRLFGSPITILNSFFQNMGALTYLALAYSGLREVPSEITELSHLQYLNLAGNEIVQLPKELSHLKRLKYLILGRTRHIPRGLLSGLEKLEVLDLFDSGYTKWGMEGEASIEELAGGTMAPGVNNPKGLGKVKQVWKNWLGGGMEGEASIEELAGGTMAPGVNKLKGLGIAVANMSDKLLTQILYQSKISNRPITLWKLCISFLRGVKILDLSETLLRSNGALLSLQSLSIERGDMKEILMTSEEKIQFEKLSLFMLRDLDELTKITWKGGIPPGELFAYLSEVQIIDCSKLCDVTWIAQLRHLEMLLIIRCRMLEKVLIDGANQEKDHDDDDDDVGAEQEERRATTMILPNLRHLTLSDLPNLKSFCSPEIRFPKLKSVRIEDCPQLDKKPFM